MKTEQILTYISWIKTTELSRYMQKKLIKQILTNKENK